MMRPSYLIGTVLVAASCAGCSIDIQGRGVSLREEKHFTVSDAGPTILRLRTFDGAVHVQSWDRNEVLVEIERRGPDKASTEALTVSATQDGDMITIEGPTPPNNVVTFGTLTSRGVNLRVTAPKRLTLEARTGDGPIDVSDVQGSVDLASGDGPVSVTRVKGPVKVHTGDGPIRIDTVTGEVDADSGDGPIEIEGSLSVLTVRTGDGNVRVDAVEGSAMNADWHVTTGDGTITMKLPEGFSAMVEASTGDGRVRISGVTDRSRDDDSDRHSVNTQLGSGGHTLRMHTGDGSINVSQ